MAFRLATGSAPGLGLRVLAGVAVLGVIVWWGHIDIGRVRLVKYAFEDRLSSSSIQGHDRSLVQEPGAAGAGAAALAAATAAPAACPPPVECPQAAAECPECPACAECPTAECPECPQAAEKECPMADCPECPQVPEKECPECNCEAAAAGGGDAGSTSGNGSKEQKKTQHGAGSGGLVRWQDSPFVGNLDHKFELPSRAMDKGIVSYGDLTRARRAMNKLLTGQPLTVGIIGGSISWNAGSDHRYSNLLEAWLKRAFPKAANKVVNGAMPAIPSSYFALCCYWHVPEDADIVILELSINDAENPADSPMRRAHERLIRKLLLFKNRPVVLELLFWPHPWKHIDGVGFDGWEEKRIPFRYHPGDEEMGVLAQYYHMPWLGIRSLIWDYINHTRAEPPAPLQKVKDFYAYFFNDPGHPNKRGHRYLADLLIYWMQRTLDDLSLHPLGPGDEEEAQLPLTVPMYRDNYQSYNNTCLFGQQFKDMVVQHDEAFKWINEGTEKSPKFGYISFEPGTSLQFKVNTNVAESSKSQGAVSMAMGYLRSYENMGQFEVECVSGCTCNTTRMDGYLPEERNSQLQLSQFMVSAADECVVKVTVLKETRSEKNKVKLLGVIISESAGFLVNHSNDQGIQVKFNDQGDGKVAENGFIG